MNPNATRAFQPPVPFRIRPQVMKRTFQIWFPVGAVVAAILFWCYAHLEAYCFFYPGIDTQYAPGFSESAFSQVTTGMTAQAVRQLLGSPLNVQSWKDGREVWAYTLDGKCKWGDWAWLGRTVKFRNGAVTVIEKR